MFIQKNIILQILAILPSIGCGWVTPILSRYKDSETDFSLSTEACSLIASLHYAGKGIACLLTVVLVDKIGRNKMFVLSALGGFIVWIAVFMTKSIPLHILIRLLFGLSAGIVEMVTPVYIGENSSPQLRGIFGALCVIFFYSGELLAFIVGTYLSYEKIAIIFATITFIVIVSMSLLKEPAQYLLTKGHEEKATKTFFALRGISEATKQEFEETKHDVGQRRVTFSMDLLTDKRIRVVCIVNLFMYLTGYPPINAMSSLAFSSVGNLSPNELTILLGIIQLVSIFFSSAIIEKIGRRPLLISSATACIVFHTINTIVYYFKERGTPIPHTSCLLFVSITAYSVTVASLLFPLCTVIRGELLSPQLKPIGSSLAVGLNSILSVGMTTAFLIVAETYGMKANFFFFALMSASMLVYVYFDVPETKGLSLTQIQRSVNK